MNHQPEHHQDKPAAKAKPEKPFQWILWWQIDGKELKEQVEKYDTMKITQSARGISFILCMVSVAVTTLFVLILNLDPWSFLDAGLLLVLGILICKGYSWAMIAAMVLWTFEKIYSLYGQVSLISETNSGASYLVPTIIWWTVYMHSFYLAFRVEQARKKA